MAVQVNDQLDVLPHRAVPVASDLLDQPAAEQPERPGDDQQPADAVPSDAPDQERPEVLHHLNDGQTAAWEAEVEDPAVGDGRAVRYPDDPGRRGYHVRILDHGLDDPQQRVLLEDGVGVDRAVVGMRRRVDPGVQRVRLAAVRLVEHPQAATTARDVGAPERCRRDSRAQRLAHRHEVERLAQALEGLVGRAVVDDDHLVPRITQIEQRGGRGHDARLFVVGGQQHGHVGRERRGEDLVERHVRAPAPELGEPVPGDDREPDVDADLNREEHEGDP
jgi:hypothetical protein